MGVGITSLLLLYLFLETEAKKEADFVFQKGLPGGVATSITRNHAMYVVSTFLSSTKHATMARFTMFVYKLLFDFFFFFTFFQKFIFAVEIHRLL